MSKSKMVTIDGSEGICHMAYKLNELIAIYPITPSSAISERADLLSSKGWKNLAADHKDEAKTAATFVTDREGRRWVLPGDFARMEDDGTFTLLGRGSGCINSGGEKIFPDEIEGVLAQHPAVRHAAVVGVPDPKMMQKVVALVELEDPAKPVSIDDLQRHCREHLAGYKIPRAVYLTEIRRLPTGKIDTVWARAHAEAEDAKAGA